MARPKSKKKNKRNKGGELEHETVLKTVGWGGWGEVGVLERAEGTQDSLTLSQRFQRKSVGHISKEPLHLVGSKEKLLAPNTKRKQ